jgi:hypothetical protein
MRTRRQVSVTFDERRGYVGTAPELRAPVVALSLSSLRRRIEAALMTRRRRRAARGSTAPPGFERDQCRRGGEQGHERVWPR